MTDSDVLDDITVNIDNGDHHRIDDIFTPVLFHIGHQPVPRPFTFDRIPQVFKGAAWHGGVADDVVGFSQQFVARIPADFAEFVVDVGYHAFGVGL